DATIPPVGTFQRAIATVTTMLGLAAALSVPASAQQGATYGKPITLTLESFSDVSTNEAASTYSQGLTHRYVDGELRFLTLVFRQQPLWTASTLHEFRLPPSGETQRAITGEWDLSGIDALLGSYHGIWFEQAKN